MSAATKATFEAEPAEDEQAPAARDAWHAPGLFMRSTEGLALVANVRALLEHHEKRDRVRRTSSEESWGQVVMSLTAGLARAHLGGYAGGLAVALGKPKKAFDRSRYAVVPLPPLMMRAAANLLAIAGLAALTTGGFVNRQRRLSTLQPTARFAELVAAHDVSLEDIEDAPGRETIILRDPKRHRLAAHGDNAEYVDTDLTRAMRVELEEVNGWLTEADLSIAEGGPTVDRTDRRMRRVFHRTEWPIEGFPDFTLGGRLYGGFWQPMKSSLRLRYLRIDGQPIAIVDWSAAFLRMAYAEQHSEPPKGDLYGFRPSHQRAGIKRAVSALLSAPRALKRWPRDVGESFPGEQWADVKAEIIRHHPPLEELAGTSFGLKAMHRESVALLQALRDLHRQGITALPIHDGIAVSQLHASASLEAMKRAFRDVVGVEGEAEVERYREE